MAETNMTGATADGAHGLPCVTGLFAETWFHRDPFAPLGAPAGNYLLAALGLHARAKSVCLRSLAPVGLECTLGHEKYWLLIRSTVLGQTVSINHFRHYLQTHLPGLHPIFRFTLRVQSSGFNLLGSIFVET